MLDPIPAGATAGPDLSRSRGALSEAIRVGLVSVFVLACLGLPASAASKCQALWWERNSYYKDAGYCFQTDRAIEAFGNKGCRYRNQADVPLSASVRDRIAEIRALEKAAGCD
ncbi:YARHG domain-containing protein [Zavarzinia sp. CC-PAN008]|uniref:YARHG domain-containing protein n=1 Tax=Zavarzinia sp. CC-PAN008 TaxID=3243332 RepID=UPI003F74758F